MNNSITAYYSDEVYVREREWVSGSCIRKTAIYQYTQKRSKSF